MRGKDMKGKVGIHCFRVRNWEIEKAMLLRSWAEKKRKTAATGECKVKGRNLERQGPEHLYELKRKDRTGRKTEDTEEKEVTY